MNKRDAKRAADAFEGTVGDVRQMIAEAPRDGMSAINPAITKARALDLFAAALDGRESHERLKMFAFPDGSGGGTRDRMTVQNVYRECM